MSCLCLECAAGPRGQDGHGQLDLMPRSQVGIAALRFVLECRDCGSRWFRQFSPQGPTWTMVA